MSKFMFPKMTQTNSLVSRFLPFMSAALNTVLGIVLVNLSKGSLNVLHDSELLISKFDSFYSLELVSAIFYQIFIFSPKDSPLKTMKNVFYSI